MEALLTELALNGTVREPAPVTTAVLDREDLHLWALLESDAAAVLVTGDTLRRRAFEPNRVLSPRRFLLLLRSG